MTAESAPAPAQARRAPGLWIPIARVAGVRVYLDPLLPLLLLALVATGVLGHEAGLLLLAFLLFVLVHEAGHAFVARRRGLAVSGIYVHLLSATWVERGTAADTWRVALGGPAANLLLGGVLLGARALAGPLPAPHLDAVAADPLAFAAAANLGIGLLNLLPFLPADGGWALRALLQERVSRAVAAWVTAGLGLLAGGALALYGFVFAPSPEGLYLALLGLYLALVAARAAGRR